jgi:two-component system sensor histidine kinase KdpD
MVLARREDPDRHPSPEALLQAAARESRGKLKIFLGAAPGVGKTFEMLQSARRKRAEGVDVAVGVVETHGRAETGALLDGLEVLPRRRIAYKGRELEEMDLDAALARRPTLLLVDELAHSNAPGSRHPKRHLDVEELLAAGIDVYTTMNIQHLESLNDVVARITRIRVRETVPDSILDGANEVELVDLTPEELTKRLAEGKVYVKEQAERALRHYFSPGNLTALRELALRRTAQRVDQQMVDYMRAHAISGPWAAGERILVCIGDGGGAAELVRYAKRAADLRHAPWTAIHVEIAGYRRPAEAERDRIADTLRLAQRLGAETLTIPGGRVADEAIAYARDNNITQIVLGRPRRGRLLRFLAGSVVDELLRTADGISLHLLTAGGESVPAKTVRTRAADSPSDLQRYAASAALVALATLLGVGLQDVVQPSSVPLIFLAAVLASAVWHGLWPSLAAALMASLCYNFFFLPPLYRFTVAEPANVTALFFFTLTALLASGLAARVRSQTLSARREARTTAQLLSFNGKLGGIAALDDLMWATASQIARMLSVEVVLLIGEKDDLAVRGAYPPEDQLDESDLAAAKWCWAHNQPAGRGADTLPGGKRLFLPMRTGRGKVGVIGIARAEPGPLFTPDERRLLDALIDQAALAVERIHLAEEMDQARLLAESERLRGALLTSISHDLRTPLATIIGGLTSLRSFGKLYDEREREEMIGMTLEEAERLNRFVVNLLDMTRLDAGAIAPKSESIDLSDVVGTVLQRTTRLLARHRVDVDLAADLPMLRLDFLLMEQVLVNLLDNAAKYAPAGSTVTVTARREGDGIAIEVADEGPGIPEADLERVFDKFYRVQNADRQRAGTGLGLAICRGFVEAMGGRIQARRRSDRSGTLFAIQLPPAAISAQADSMGPA